MSGKCEKCVAIMGTLTVEPLTVLFYVATSFMMPTDDALWYRKVCLHLYQDQELCGDINKNASYTEMEQEVQRINSQWNFYRTTSFSLPAMLTTFLYGSWSDRISRKLPIFLPLFGLLVGSCINMASAVFTMSPLWILLMASALQGMLGGMLTMLVSTMSYISDISTPESRTMRISILYASSNIGSLIAYTLSGVIFDHSGFVVMYSICITFTFISIFYTGVFVADIKPNNSQNQNTQDEDLSKQTEHTCNGKVKRICQKYCDVSHAKEAFLVTFRRRENNHRAHIVAVLVILLFYMIGGCKCIYIYFVKNAYLKMNRLE